MEAKGALRLQATPENWRYFMLRRKDKKFLSYREAVLDRDQYICQYCGHKGHNDLEIVNRDANYKNNVKQNLLTACIFCAQCGFLEALGETGFGGGVLIYLPSLTQEELNAATHVVFSSFLNNAENTFAKKFYRELRLRAQLVEKELGRGMSQPAFYAQALIEMSITGNKRVELESSLRLLPLWNNFFEYSISAQFSFVCQLYRDVECEF